MHNMKHYENAIMFYASANYMCSIHAERRMGICEFYAPGAGWTLLPVEHVYLFCMNYV